MTTTYDTKKSRQLRLIGKSVVRLNGTIATKSIVFITTAILLNLILFDRVQLIQSANRPNWLRDKIDKWFHRDDPTYDQPYAAPMNIGNPYNPYSSAAASSAYANDMPAYGALPQSFNIRANNGNSHNGANPGSSSAAGNYYYYPQQQPPLHRQQPQSLPSGRSAIPTYQGRPLHMTTNNERQPASGPFTYNPGTAPSYVPSNQHTHNNNKEPLTRHDSLGDPRPSRIPALPKSNRRFNDEAPNNNLDARARRASKDVPLSGGQQGRPSASNNNQRQQLADNRRPATGNSLPAANSRPADRRYSDPPTMRRPKPDREALNPANNNNNIRPRNGPSLDRDQKKSNVSPVEESPWNRGRFNYDNNNLTGQQKRNNSNMRPTSNRSTVIDEDHNRKKHPTTPDASQKKQSDLPSRGTKKAGDNLDVRDRNSKNQNSDDGRTVDPRRRTPSNPMATSKDRRSSNQSATTSDSYGNRRQAVSDRSMRDQSKLIDNSQSSRLGEEEKHQTSKDRQRSDDINSTTRKQTNGRRQSESDSNKRRSSEINDRRSEKKKNTTNDSLSRNSLNGGQDRRSKSLTKFDDDSKTKHKSLDKDRQKSRLIDNSRSLNNNREAKNQNDRSSGSVSDLRQNSHDINTSRSDKGSEQRRRTSSSDANRNSRESKINRHGSVSSDDERGDEKTINNQDNKSSSFKDTNNKFDTSLMQDRKKSNQRRDSDRHQSKSFTRNDSNDRRDSAADNFNSRRTSSSSSNLNDNRQDNAREEANQSTGKYNSASNSSDNVFSKSSQDRRRGDSLLDRKESSSNYSDENRLKDKSANSQRHSSRDDSLENSRDRSSSTDSRDRSSSANSRDQSSSASNSSRNLSANNKKIVDSGDIVSGSARGSNRNKKINMDKHKRKDRHRRDRSSKRNDSSDKDARRSNKHQRRRDGSSKSSSDDESRQHRNNNKNDSHMQSSDSESSDTQATSKNRSQMGDNKYSESRSKRNKQQSSSSNDDNNSSSTTTTTTTTDTTREILDADEQKQTDNESNKKKNEYDSLRGQKNVLHNREKTLNKVDSMNDDDLDDSNSNNNRDKMSSENSKEHDDYVDDFKRTPSIDDEMDNNRIDNSYSEDDNPLDNDHDVSSRKSRPPERSESRVDRIPATPTATDKVGGPVDDDNQSAGRSRSEESPQRQPQEDISSKGVTNNSKPNAVNKGTSIDNNSDSAINEPGDSRIPQKESSDPRNESYSRDKNPQESNEGRKSDRAFSELDQAKPDSFGDSSPELMPDDAKKFNPDGNKNESHDESADKPDNTNESSIIPQKNVYPHSPASNVVPDDGGITDAQKKQSFPPDFSGSRYKKPDKSEDIDHPQKANPVSTEDPSNYSSPTAALGNNDDPNNGQDNYPSNNDKGQTDIPSTPEKKQDKSNDEDDDGTNSRSNRSRSGLPSPKRPSSTMEDPSVEGPKKSGDAISKDALISPHNQNDKSAADDPSKYKENQGNDRPINDSFDQSTNVPNRGSDNKENDSDYDKETNPQRAESSPEKEREQNNDNDSPTTNPFDKEGVEKLFKDVYPDGEVPSNGPEDRERKDKEGHQSNNNSEPNNNSTPKSQSEGIDAGTKEVPSESTTSPYSTQNSSNNPENNKKGSPESNNGDESKSKLPDNGDGNKEPERFPTDPKNLLDNKDDLIDNDDGLNDSKLNGKDRGDTADPTNDSQRDSKSGDGSPAKLNDGVHDQTGNNDPVTDKSSKSSVSNPYVTENSDHSVNSGSTKPRKISPHDDNRDSSQRPDKGDNTDDDITGGNSENKDSSSKDMSGPVDPKKILDDQDAPNLSKSNDPDDSRNSDDPDDININFNEDDDNNDEIDYNNQPEDDLFDDAQDEPNDEEAPGQFGLKLRDEPDESKKDEQNKRLAQDPNSDKDRLLKRPGKDFLEDGDADSIADSDDGQDSFHSADQNNAQADPDDIGIPDLDEDIVEDDIEEGTKPSKSEDSVANGLPDDSANGEPDKLGHDSQDDPGKKIDDEAKDSNLNGGDNIADDILRPSSQQQNNNHKDYIDPSGKLEKVDSNKPTSDTSSPSTNLENKEDDNKNDPSERKDHSTNNVHNDNDSNDLTDDIDGSNHTSKPTSHDDHLSPSRVDANEPLDPMKDDSINAGEEAEDSIPIVLNDSDDEDGANDDPRNAPPINDSDLSKEDGSRAHFSEDPSETDKKQPSEHENLSSNDKIDPQSKHDSPPANPGMSNEKMPDDSEDYDSSSSSPSGDIHDLGDDDEKFPLLSDNIHDDEYDDDDHPIDSTRSHKDDGISKEAEKPDKIDDDIVNLNNSNHGHNSNADLRKQPDNDDTLDPTMDDDQVFGDDDHHQSTTGPHDEETKHHRPSENRSRDEKPDYNHHHPNASDDTLTKEDPPVEKSSLHRNDKGPKDTTSKQEEDDDHQRERNKIVEPDLLDDQEFEDDSLEPPKTIEKDPRVDEWIPTSGEFDSKNPFISFKDEEDDENGYPNDTTSGVPSKPKPSNGDNLDPTRSNQLKIGEDLTDSPEKTPTGSNGTTQRSDENINNTNNSGDADKKNPIDKQLSDSGDDDNSTTMSPDSLESTPTIELGQNKCPTCKLSSSNEQPLGSPWTLSMLQNTNNPVFTFNPIINNKIELPPLHQLPITLPNVSYGAPTYVGPSYYNYNKNNDKSPNRRNNSRRRSSSPQRGKENDTHSGVKNKSHRDRSPSPQRRNRHHKDDYYGYSDDDSRSGNSNNHDSGGTRRPENEKKPRHRGRGESRGRSRDRRPYRDNVNNNGSDESDLDQNDDYDSIHEHHDDDITDPNQELEKDSSDSKPSSHRGDNERGAKRSPSTNNGRKDRKHTKDFDNFSPRSLDKIPTEGQSSSSSSRGPSKDKSEPSVHDEATSASSPPDNRRKKKHNRHRPRNSWPDGNGDEDEGASGDSSDNDKRRSSKDDTEHKNKKHKRPHRPHKHRRDRSQNKDAPTSDDKSSKPEKQDNKSSEPQPADRSRLDENDVNSNDGAQKDYPISVRDLLEDSQSDSDLVDDSFQEIDDPSTDQLSASLDEKNIIDDGVDNSQNRAKPNEESRLKKKKKKKNRGPFRNESRSKHQREPKRRHSLNKRPHDDSQSEQSDAGPFSDSELAKKRRNNRGLKRKKNRNKKEKNSSSDDSAGSEKPSKPDEFSTNQPPPLESKFDKKREREAQQEDENLQSSSNVGDNEQLEVDTPIDLSKKRRNNVSPEDEQQGNSLYDKLFGPKDNSKTTNVDSKPDTSPGEELWNPFVKPKGSVAPELPEQKDDRSNDDDHVSFDSNRENNDVTTNDIISPVVDTTEPNLPSNKELAINEDISIHGQPLAKPDHTKERQRKYPVLIPPSGSSLKDYANEGISNKKEEVMEEKRIPNDNNGFSDNENSVVNKKRNRNDYEHPDESSEDANQSYQKNNDAIDIPGEQKSDELIFDEEVDSELPENIIEQEAVDRDENLDRVPETNIDDPQEDQQPDESIPVESSDKKRGRDLFEQQDPESSSQGENDPKRKRTNNSDEDVKEGIELSKSIPGHQESERDEASVGPKLEDPDSKSSSNDSADESSQPQSEPDPKVSDKKRSRDEFEVPSSDLATEQDNSEILADADETRSEKRKKNNELPEDELRGNELKEILDNNSHPSAYPQHPADLPQMNESSEPDSNEKLNNEENAEFPSVPEDSTENPSKEAATQEPALTTEIDSQENKPSDHDTSLEHIDIGEPNDSNNNNGNNKDDPSSIDVKEVPQSEKNGDVEGQRSYPDLVPPSGSFLSTKDDQNSGRDTIDDVAQTSNDDPSEGINDASKKRDRANLETLTASESPLDPDNEDRGGPKRRKNNELVVDEQEGNELLDTLEQQPDSSNVDEMLDRVPETNIEDPQDDRQQTDESSSVEPSNKKRGYDDFSEQQRQNLDSDDDRDAKRKRKNELLEDEKEGLELSSKYFPEHRPDGDLSSESPDDESKNKPSTDSSENKNPSPAEDQLDTKLPHERLEKHLPDTDPKIEDNTVPRYTSDEKLPEKGGTDLEENIPNDQSVEDLNVSLDKSNIDMPKDLAPSAGEVEGRSKNERESSLQSSDKKRNRDSFEPDSVDIMPIEEDSSNRDKRKKSNESEEDMNDGNKLLDNLRNSNFDRVVNNDQVGDLVEGRSSDPDLKSDESSQDPIKDASIDVTSGSSIDSKPLDSSSPVPDTSEKAIDVDAEIPKIGEDLFDDDEYQRSDRTPTVLPDNSQQKESSRVDTMDENDESDTRNDVKHLEHQLSTSSSLDFDDEAVDHGDAADHTNVYPDGSKDNDQNTDKSSMPMIELNDEDGTNQQPPDSGENPKMNPDEVADSLADTIDDPIEDAVDGAVDDDVMMESDDIMSPTNPIGEDQNSEETSGDATKSPSTDLEKEKTNELINDDDPLVSKITDVDNLKSTESNDDTTDKPEADNNQASDETLEKPESESSPTNVDTSAYHLPETHLPIENNSNDDKNQQRSHDETNVPIHTGDDDDNSNAKSSEEPLERSSSKLSEPQDLRESAELNSEQENQNDLLQEESAPSVTDADNERRGENTPKDQDSDAIDKESDTTKEVPDELKASHTNVEVPTDINGTLENPELADELSPKGDPRSDDENGSLDNQPDKSSDESSSAQKTAASIDDMTNEGNGGDHLLESSKNNLDDNATDPSTESKQTIGEDEKIDSDHNIVEPEEEPIQESIDKEHELSDGHQQPEPALVRGSDDADDGPSDYDDQSRNDPDTIGQTLDDPVQDNEMGYVDEDAKLVDEPDQKHDLEHDDKSTLESGQNHNESEIKTSENEPTSDPDSIQSEPSIDINHHDDAKQLPGVSSEEISNDTKDPTIDKELTKSESDDLPEPNSEQQKDQSRKGHGESEQHSQEQNDHSPSNQGKSSIIDESSSEENHPKSLAEEGHPLEENGSTEVDSSLNSNEETKDHASSSEHDSKDSNELIDEKEAHNTEQSHPNNDPDAIPSGSENEPVKSEVEVSQSNDNSDTIDQKNNNAELTPKDQKEVEEKDLKVENSENHAQIDETPNVEKQQNEDANDLESVGHNLDEHDSSEESPHGDGIDSVESSDAHDKSRLDPDAVAKALDDPIEDDDIQESNPQISNEPHDFIDQHSKSLSNKEPEGEGNGLANENADSDKLEQHEAQNPESKPADGESQHTINKPESDDDEKKLEESSTSDSPDKMKTEDPNDDETPLNETEVEHSGPDKEKQLPIDENKHASPTVKNVDEEESLDDGQSTQTEGNHNAELDGEPPELNDDKKTETTHSDFSKEQSESPEVDPHESLHKSAPDEHTSKDNPQQNPEEASSTSDIDQNTADANGQNNLRDDKVENHHGQPQQESADDAKPEVNDHSDDQSIEPLETGDGLPKPIPSGQEEQSTGEQTHNHLGDDPTSDRGHGEQLETENPHEEIPVIVKDQVDDSPSGSIDESAANVEPMNSVDDLPSKPSEQDKKEDEREEPNKSNQQPEHRPENKPEHQPEHQSEHQPEHQPDHQSEHQPENQPEHQPENQPEHQPDNQPEHQPEHQPENQPEHQPDNQPEHQPDHQLENQPKDQTDENNEKEETNRFADLDDDSPAVSNHNWDNSDKQQVSTTRKARNGAARIRTSPSRAQLESADNHNEDQSKELQKENQPSNNEINSDNDVKSATDPLEKEDINSVSSMAEEKANVDKDIGEKEEEQEEEDVTTIIKDRDPAPYAISNYQPTKVGEAIKSSSVSNADAISPSSTHRPPSSNDIKADLASRPVPPAMSVLEQNESSQMNARKFGAGKTNSNRNRISKLNHRLAIGGDWKPERILTDKSDNVNNSNNNRIVDEKTLTRARKIPKEEGLLDSLSASRRMPAVSYSPKRKNNL